MNGMVCQNSRLKASLQGSNIDERLWEMEAKLKVLKHCLLQGTNELDEHILRSLGYIVDDLEAGVAEAIHFHQEIDILLYNYRAEGFSA